MVKKVMDIENEEMESENEEEEINMWGKENPKIFTAYLWITNRRTGEIVSMRARDFYLSELKHNSEFSIGFANFFDFDYYKEVFDFSYRYAEIMEEDYYYKMKINVIEIINGKKKKRSYTKKFKRELLKIFPDF